MIKKNKYKNKKNESNIIFSLDLNNKNFFIILVAIFFLIFFIILLNDLNERFPLVVFFCYLFFFLFIIAFLFYKDKKIFSKSLKYINDSKNFIYFSIFLFLFFSLVSFFLPIPEIIEKEILKVLDNLIKQTEGKGLFGLVNFIFLNNILSSCLGIFLGIFLGFYSILSSILNGYILGFVFSLVYLKNGFLSLLNILPHGIFELPAIFISFGLGIKIGSFIFQKSKKKFLIESLVNSFFVFLFIIIPLLIVAAIIEGSIIFIFR
jgi:stage II sporulation protein M